MDKRRVNGELNKKNDIVSADGLALSDLVNVHASSVSTVPVTSLHATEVHHVAHPQTFTSILGERKRDGSDSDAHDEDEHEDEENDDDPTRMLPIPEDDAAFVQCPPLEQSFESWDDFHRAMEDYCIITHQPMRLRTSDSAKAVNSRAAKRNSLKEPIDEAVGFVKKLYLCTHGVKTKPRGKGKRPRQHYRYMGCPAMIRACISERKNGEGPGKNKYVVRVVAQINKHNHRLSEHLFKSYSESRVVIDDDLVVPLTHARLKDEAAAAAANAHAHAAASAAAAAAVACHVDQLTQASLDDHSLKTTNALFQTQALDLMAASRLKLRIGWIGTGIMGANMCGHILDIGYEVAVFNRTAEKCNILRDKGARIVNSPAEVAQLSDIVFVIVGYPSDVRSVILDPHTGLLANMKVGGIIVDMTTSEPSLAKEIYELAKLKGISTLDAPVSGGDIGARDATLSFMVGGDVDAVYATMQLFNVMGKNVHHMGGPGAGQHTKMMNQILIATNMIGVVEGLLYAKKAGLDLNEAIRAVSAGAAGSWTINNMGPRIVKRDFDPGFFVEHFLKDMGIALKEAERMNLSLPGLALANQLYIAVKSQGHGQLGSQALMLGLEQLNGLDLEDTIKESEVI